MGCSKKEALAIVFAGIIPVILVALALVLVLVVFAPDNSPPPPVAMTTSGTLHGRTAMLDDLGEIYEFHNIRYAEPPIGELRFRPPVRYETTDTSPVDVSDSYKQIQCIQAESGEGDEDCLFLTVRTPTPPGNDSFTPLPVIMWIHGGGLISGLGTVPGYSFGAETTAKMGVVTVNINYRLGFLGFSSVQELWDEEEGVYANNGIRDIISALDWIQDNIAEFGGDPTSVTVIGESGGGTAVLALTCSPLANNKFHRAIAQSPAPEFRFSHVDGDGYQRGIVGQMGCTQDTTEERKQCLLDLPAERFSHVPGGVAYFDFPLSYGTDGEYIGMIVTDPTVVTVAPRDLASADFNPSSPLPIIISNVEQENYDYSWFFEDPFPSDSELNETLVDAFALISAEEGMVDVAWSLYPGRSRTEIWSLLTCDMRSTCPSNDVAEAMSTATNRDIYRLYFTYALEGYPIPAIHVADSYIMFGMTFEVWSFVTPSDNDFAFSDHYVAMMKSFAEDGVPSDGWMPFPENSMVFENSDTFQRITTEKPQQDVCESFQGYGFDIYGWQNR